MIKNANALSILYESRHFLVVNKPPLVYSQPNFATRPRPHYRQRKSHRWYTSSEKEPQVLLLDLLRKEYPRFYKSELVYPFTRPALVHRLDYGVSGAMIISTSSLAARQFGRNLKLGGEKGWPIKKKYLAIVEPAYDSPIFTEISNAEITFFPDDDRAGEITKPLLYEDSNELLKCTTRFKVLAGLPSARLLIELDLVTGRKHQLRRHCAEVLRAPIVGDSKYGLDTVNDNNKNDSQIALHSYQLDFKPGLGDWQSIQAPINWGREKGEVWYDARQFIF
ncbi:pseudouridine synthase [Lipomyces japonicus]|uniref:pseudouridine synthase n=1 Tax=Lipomyces japonicus TaxID=56871 RepID=UPI0034CDA584